MNLFHDPKSARQKGTLANIRVVYGHKNVLQNTKKCFNATHEFVEFATTACYCCSIESYENFTSENNSTRLPINIRRQAIVSQQCSSKGTIFETKHMFDLCCFKNNWKSTKAIVSCIRLQIRYLSMLI